MHDPVAAALGRPCSEGEDQTGTGPDDDRETIASTRWAAKSLLRPPAPARPARPPFCVPELRVHPQFR